MHVSIPQGRIEPFYFGTTDKPLFGGYHAPLSGPSRECGVILCSPMGDEYIRFHRPYRQLAIQLSTAGFPVLRFDFYGCGDSSGNCDQGRIGQWLSDISTAIGEIRHRCDVAKICLVGLRLGGTLALMAGAVQGGIDGLVLWDPVINGRTYIRELIALHQDMLRYAHVQSLSDMAGEKPTEILGFPLTESLQKDLETIDLLAIQQNPASHILIIDTRTAAAGQGWRQEHLQKIKTQVKYHHFPTSQLWIWKEDFSTILVPPQILHSIVSWISEVYP